MIIALVFASFKDSLKIEYGILIYEPKCKPLIIESSSPSKSKKPLTEQAYLPTLLLESLIIFEIITQEKKRVSSFVFFECLLQYMYEKLAIFLFKPTLSENSSKLLGAFEVEKAK